MSYTVLARRYRSGTFDEVVGQSHVAQTLKRAIESGRIAHAYLFCGTRGTGKTSTARILAKALNCERSDQPTTQPCGQCESCKAIARGDDIDVIEIDAASNTGVDNIREVIENSQYRPARSRFKIYIIDEVHMLSKSAFNALLKTLEEPPGHVKFILATTEPEKVLATILSRCQRYDFRNIPTREIAGHLASICKQEGIEAEDDALLLVAKAGAGSMRDSLSLLDRVLSLGEKRVTLELIEGLLGLPKSQLMFDLAQAVGSGDVKSALQQADAIITNGLSVDSLLASLVEHLRNLLILNTCGPDCNLVEVPGLSLKDLNAQAQQFDPVALSQDIAILEELRRQVRQSQAGRALLDATLVRMTLSEQFASVSDLLARLDGNGAPAGAQKKKLEPVVAGSGSRVPGSGNVVAPPQPAVAQPVAPVAAASPPLPSPVAEPEKPSAPPPVAAPLSLDLDDSSSTPSSPPASTSSSAELEGDALPAVGKVWDDGPKKSLSTIMAEAKRAAAKAATAPKPVVDPFANVETVDPTNMPQVWQAMLRVLSQKGQVVTGMVSQAQFGGLDEQGQAIVRFAKSQQMFVKMLDRNDKRELVSDAFTKVLNQTVGVRFEVDESLPDPTPPKPTSSPPNRPAARPQQQAAAAPEPQAPQSNAIRLTPELRAEIEADPLVRAVMENLGGSVVRLE